MRWGIWILGVGAGLWLGAMLSPYLTPIWLLSGAALATATGLWIGGEERGRRRKSS